MKIYLNTSAEKPQINFTLLNQVKSGEAKLIAEHLAKHGAKIDPKAATSKSVAHALAKLVKQKLRPQVEAKYHAAKKAGKTNIDPKSLVPSQGQIKAMISTFLKGIKTGPAQPTTITSSTFGKVGKTVGNLLFDTVKPLSRVAKEIVRVVSLNVLVMVCAQIVFYALIAFASSLCGNSHGTR